MEWHAGTGDMLGSSSKPGERSVARATEWGALSGKSEQLWLSWVFKPPCNKQPFSKELLSSACVAEETKASQDQYVLLLSIKKPQFELEKLHEGPLVFISSPFSQAFVYNMFH